MIFLTMRLEKESDRMLLSELFALNYDRMKNTAIGILHDPEAAQDVVQDTFERCLKKIDTLQSLPEKAQSVYLLTALRHNALNRLHKTGAHPSIPLEEIPDTDVSVEEHAIRNLTVEEVKDAISKLPDSIKDVLRYKYLLELSDSEIAKTLGVSKTTVRVYLMRARRAVLNLCKENGYAE